MQIHWITDTINVLLTAAIAWAGYRQYVVSNQLLSLQRLIENKAHSVSLFLRIKPTTENGHSEATLEVTNLSSFGIWLEDLTVYLLENKGHIVKLEQKLMAGDTFKFSIRGELVALAGLVSDGQRTSADVWVAVKYWSDEKWMTAETEKYHIGFNRFQVEQIFPTVGKSLED